MLMPSLSKVLASSALAGTFLTYLCKPIYPARTQSFHLQRHATTHGLSDSMRTWTLPGCIEQGPERSTLETGPAPTFLAMKTIGILMAILLILLRLLMIITMIIRIAIRALVSLTIAVIGKASVLNQTMQFHVCHGAKHCNSHCKNQCSCHCMTY